MNILTIEHIHISLGDKVIFRDLTAGIDSQDRIGVIGVNGTGKSTILSVIAGTMQADEGKLITRSGLRISFLPQDPVFDPEKTVLENVVSTISGKEEHWNTEGEAKALLLRFGIEDPDIKPQLLSGGQKKRAAATAAASSP